jgi:hypothetical protein
MVVAVSRVYEMASFRFWDGFTEFLGRVQPEFHRFLSIRQCCIRRCAMRHAFWQFRHISDKDLVVVASIHDGFVHAQSVFHTRKHLKWHSGRSLSSISFSGSGKLLDCCY